MDDRDRAQTTGAPEDDEENENGDKESPLDDLDEAVASADDTGMVAQQQIIAEQIEQPPLHDT